jgi:hypothetical protein
VYHESGRIPASVEGGREAAGRGEPDLFLLKKEMKMMIFT